VVCFVRVVQSGFWFQNGLLVGGKRGMVQVRRTAVRIFRNAGHFLATSGEKINSGQFHCHATGLCFLAVWVF
jgi:hypothetical protein